MLDLFAGYGGPPMGSIEAPLSEGVPLRQQIKNRSRVFADRGALVRLHWRRVPMMDMRQPEP